MTPKCGSGFLIAAYLVFGMAWTSMERSYGAMPSFQNVTFKECRKTCVTPTSGPHAGVKVCTTTCSTTTGKREPTKATNAPPQGSTGPTVPPKPVTHY